MIGALWTGISGLSSQQKALDNESNNVANVNTIGYKSSRISFADQMYQDRIGKGSKILDAEKLYTQGNLKLTGVNYDMALSGDGFFTVLNTRSSGSSETLYTRAGNFRMGDNGTLQDAAGNEVQGWAMTALDTQNDVTSTNPNVKVFNTDYSKLLGSKVIKHDNYVETITAKATNYSNTAKSDSSTVFSGSGLKTKASKIADIEAAITDYTNWLQKLKDEPNGLSATSIAQVSEINYKTGANGIISKDGDQLYAYVNGSKISQNYVVTSATNAQMLELWNGLSATERTAAGLVDPTTPPTAANDIAAYDKAISRIATYKAMADKISAIPGLSAYMVSESGGSNNDVWEKEDTFKLSTKLTDMYYGRIEVKSLIPGKEFTISEVGEISGTQVSTGSANISTYSSAGSGIGALESSRNALSKLITGKQEDVYASDSSGLKMDGTTSQTYTYSINVYDKDLGKTIPVPNSGGTILTEKPISITAKTVDEFIAAFNANKDASGKALSPKLTDYVEAVNINGNLVIRTLDKNYDVDFSSGLKIATGPLSVTTNAAKNKVTVAIPSTVTIPTDYSMIVDGVVATYTSVPGDNQAAVVTGLTAALTALKSATIPLPVGKISNNITITAGSGSTAGTITLDTSGVTPAQTIAASLNPASTLSYTPIDKNTDFSGRAGAGAEFIEIKNKVDQTASKDSLQLRLDTLGLSDTAFGEFAVDSTGLITMKQDGAEFAIGQVAIALFNNNQGLNPAGDNLLAKTNDSGEPIYNINNEKTAKVAGKTLELSTADLSESLVNLMVFQRAFEANAKSITTSDELLNTLINLKR